MPIIERRPWLAWACIAMAVLFNVPYAILASIYDYPAVLRGPAATALDLFAAGGPTLVLSWHAFALAAFALAPLAVALAITPGRIARNPALAVSTALFGALAGVTQAMGLWRWVFVVPGLARDHAAPAASAAAKAAAEQGFALLNQYAGVAIGEHLGQLLTALFVGCLSRLQWIEGRKATAITGYLTGAAIFCGTHEGVAIALGRSGDLFSILTIVGFLGLTVWLILTGSTLLRRPKAT